jgi:hypothetical protein
MFWAIFWIVIIVLIVLSFISYSQMKFRTEEENKKRPNLHKKLEELENFTFTNKFVGIGNKYLLAVDQDNQKIAYITIYSERVIPFNQLLSVEVIEDNIIISHKSSLRTIGGAVAGGAIAGGAGAIVGGLSGDSKQNKKVSKVQVKIKLRDIDNPSFTINCFDCITMTITGEPVNPNSVKYGDIYKLGLNNAQRIADTLSVIIDVTDRLEKSSINIPKLFNVSVADELIKLADLKEKGILTEDEFMVQKQLLLSGSTTIN